jgi:hypothetical protein
MSSGIAASCDRCTTRVKPESAISGAAFGKVVLGTEQWQ